MKRITGLIALVLVAWLAMENPLPFAPDPEAPTSTVPSNAGPIIPDVAVRDVDGRVAWRGDVDLGPAIERIERGERDPHRNDGEVFSNRERRLPDRPRGYYREFVVRTPGIRHAGPQRLVIGRRGEAWYTADHYRSFLRLDVEVHPP